MSDRKFVIIVDSIAALGKAEREAYGVDDICPMTVSIDDQDVIASPDYDQGYSCHDYFEIMRQGKRIFTSQVPVPTFEDRFNHYVEKGCDILYIGCSLRLSKSVEAGQKVAENILKKHPEAKIICFDARNSNKAVGDMARTAARLRGEGKTLEEVHEYLLANRNRWNQFGAVETLTYLRQAGRVKTSKAFFGNLFSIKPILISDTEGNNYAIKNCKGRKNSLLEIARMSVEAVEDPKEAIFYISHADDEAAAELVKVEILRLCKPKEINVGPFDPIVGASTGPGTVAVYVFGKEVTFTSPE